MQGRARKTRMLVGTYWGRERGEEERKGRGKGEGEGRGGRERGEGEGRGGGGYQSCKGLENSVEKAGDGGGESVSLQEE
eukprot:421534-Hanusia_phi.AAC.1